MEGRTRLGLVGLVWVGALIAAGTQAQAYVVPGSFPRDYRQGDELEVHVNALYSNVTAITYDFYSLPFCEPEGEAHVDESLGEWFLGGRIKQAPFGFKFLDNVEKNLTCKNTLDRNSARDLRNRIKEKYKVRMILDNLPVTRLSLSKFFELSKKYGEDAVEEAVDTGYSYIGYEVGGQIHGNDTHKAQWYINNHLTFSVLTHPAEPTGSLSQGFYTGDGTNVGPSDAAKGNEANGDDEPVLNIVGFQVYACSVDSEVLRSSDFEAQNCDKYAKQYFEPGTEVQYSYAVYFQESEITWDERWLPFLHIRGKPMHWYSFIDSLLIALLLAILVASILLRTVNLDIKRYEQLTANDDIGSEDTGWKLVSGDVFRNPPKPNKLSLYIGSGVHVATCLMLSLLLMACGMISAVKRGAFMTWIIVTYFLLAVIGGYTGTRCYINLTRGKEGWRAMAFKIGAFFPGIAISILTLMNIVLSANNSSQAVPFMPMFIVFLMWVFLALPLSVIGGFIASKRDPVKYPVRTNQIPREIAQKPANWLTHPLLLTMLAGMLPFGVMYVDLYYIFTAMFENLYYYAFGFLFGMGIITGIVCIEMSIVSTYMLLCLEDWRWWWRSFYAGGSVAIYFFLYGLSFLFLDSNLVGGLSAFVFMCYVSMMSLVIFLGMGALSFSVSYLFVRKIYGAIKAD